MINCLLTVARCTLITNHPAAENGIFQQNDLHQSSTILLMEEKPIPKKLEKAKDSYGILSGGKWGARGGVRAGSAAPGCAGLRGWKGKQKPCAAASHLMGCKTRDKL